jgi:hypothetical protein
MITAPTDNMIIDFDEDGYNDLIDALCKTIGQQATSRHLQSSALIHALAYVAARAIVLSSQEKTDESRAALLSAFFNETKEFAARNLDDAVGKLTTLGNDG